MRSIPKNYKSLFGFEQWVENLNEHRNEEERRPHLKIVGVVEEILHDVALGDYPDGAHLLQVELEPPPPTVQLLLGQGERPLAGQLREVEVHEVPLQVVVEGGELAVAPRAQVPPRHVYVEHHELLAIGLHVGIVRDGDGQGPLLAVVDVGEARGLFARLQPLRLLQQEDDWRPNGSPCSLTDGWPVAKRDPSLNLGSTCTGDGRGDSSLNDRLV